MEVVLLVSKKIPVTKRDKSFPKPETAPSPAMFGAEIGVEQNMPFAAPFNPRDAGGKSPGDEFKEQFRAEDETFGPTVPQLQAMRRMDGQARALYALITGPIMAALKNSAIIPAPDGEEEAEFIDAVFNTPPQSGGMVVDFETFMAQLLMSLFDGFTPFEKVFWRPESGPLKNKVTLKKLAHRDADTITFITDKYGGFEGFRQRAYLHGETVDKFIPKQHSFYYAAREEERKFYGVSFFQAAFYHYDKKAKIYYLSHLAAQRTAVGTRVGTVPANATPEQRKQFMRALSDLAFAQYMTIPEGYKVEILAERGNFDYLSSINHHNSQMSKSVLAAFFDKDQGSGENDGMLINFGSPGDGMFILQLRAIMDRIASKINHYIIPQLIDFNFKGGKYPKFTWGRLTDEQRTAIATTFNKLMLAPASGVTPEFMRELEIQMAEEFGLEIDYEEIEKLEAQQVEQMAAEQEAMMAAQAQGVDPNAASGAAPAGAPAPGGTPAAGVVPETMTLEQFEQMVLDKIGEGESTPETKKEPEKKEVKLSQSEEDPLVTLAREMLDEASNGS